MKTKIEVWLNLIQNDLIQRNLQINLYLLLAICLTGLASIFVVTLTNQNVISQAALGIIFLLLSGTLWFIHQRHLMVASLIVVIISFVGANYLVFTSEYGLYDISMYGYLIVTMMAGLLFGSKGITLLTGLTLSVVWFIYAGQAQGLYIGDVGRSRISFLDVVILSFLWLVVNAIFNITVRNLNYLIQHAQEQEQVVLARNEALEAIQASLEDTVQERTQKAELAQRDAELARKQMAQQVWLMQGLAELADVMRGEQSVEQLGQGVIRTICQYLQVPTGALFVMEEEKLNFAGGYAFTPPHEQLSFDMGEGFIGEAARTREPLELQADEDQPWQVVFGTTVHQVQHTLIYPFLYEEAVISIDCLRCATCPTRPSPTAKVVS